MQYRYRHNFFTSLKMLLATTAIFLVLLPGSLFGQNDRPILNDLQRVQRTLEQITSLVEILPRISDGNIRQLIENRLNEARMKFREAERLFNEGRLTQARLKLAEVIVLIRQIESLIQNNSVLRNRFLEEVNLKIRRAEELLQNRQNPEAVYLLQRAKQFQRDADQFASNGQIFMAIEFYRIAGKLADQIIKKLGGSDVAGDAEQLQSLFQETKMMVEQIQRIANNNDRADLNTVVQRAINELRNIENLYETGHIAKARRRLTALNRMAYRMIDRLRSGNNNSGQSLDEQLVALEGAMQALQPDLDGADNPAVKKLYSRTEQLLRQSRRHIRTNRPLLARNKLNRANVLILKIYQLIDAAPETNTAKIENQLLLARRDLQQKQQQKPDEAHLKGLLDLIDGQLNQSESQFKKDSPLQALYSLKIANRLMLRYNALERRSTASDVNRQIIEDELQRLKGLLDRLRDESLSDPEFGVRYRTGERIYKLAEAALREGKLLAAKMLIREATNIVSE